MQHFLLKLLVVDDKPAERNGIINVVDWSNIGISIVGEAENGLDGIEKARQLKPDIIITDIVMPYLDGFKMVEEIQKFLPDIKVIFISCFDNFNYAKLAIEMNAMGYVLKPIIAGELLSTIGKVTGIHIREIERKRDEEELIRRLRQSMPVMRDQFVKDLLFGLLKDENEIWDKNDFLETRFTTGTYSVLAVEIDPPGGKKAEMPEERKQLQHFKIKEQISKACETIYAHAVCYITSTEHSKFIILINQPDGQVKNACSFADRLRDELSARLNMDLTIGVSRTVDHVTRVHQCYQEACDALKFKFYLGKNQTISYSEIYKGESLKVQDQIDLRAVENELKYIIMTGEQKDIDRFLDRLFGKQATGQDIYYIQHICISIVAFIQFVLHEMNESLHKVYDNEFYIYEQLFKLDTIVEIRQWVRGFLETVSSYLLSRDRSKNRKVINAIKEYINANYTEDLTVAKIAEKVYLSPCYTNYIFKKETGETLMEYLSRIRINKAKALLKNTLLKVYEVAEQVGFKSNSYFCSVFKEHCGMTPLEYRDRS